MAIPKEKYIPINKGHFDLDTQERIEAFQNKLAFKWENEYREYRQNWVDLPRKRLVRDYPLLVDLEMSSICNLHCPMCPTITEEYKRKVKTGLMDERLAKKVIDEIAGHVFALRLSLVGEPTLHPKLIDIITHAKSNKIQEVSFLTNGSRMELDYFKKLSDAGIDWITISIDGIGETYNAIRKPLRFEDTLNKLQKIRKYKDDNGLVKPVIKVQGVWPSIRPDPTEYYNILAPLVDLLAYNPLIDYLKKDSDDQILFEDNFACPQFYQRLVVCSDGSVKACSNDEDRLAIVGDASRESIHEIWHGEKLERIRSLHNEKDGFLQMNICRHCYYPRKTVPDEQATVNDRTIIIENYVNRKQEVGK